MEWDKQVIYRAVLQPDRERDDWRRHADKQEYSIEVIQQRNGTWAFAIYEDSGEDVSDDYTDEPTVDIETAEEAMRLAEQAYLNMKKRWQQIMGE